MREYTARLAEGARQARIDLVEAGPAEIDEGPINSEGIDDTGVAIGAIERPNKHITRAMRGISRQQDFGLKWENLLDPVEYEVMAGDPFHGVDDSAVPVRIRQLAARVCDAYPSRSQLTTSLPDQIDQDGALRHDSPLVQYAKPGSLFHRMIWLWLLGHGLC